MTAGRPALDRAPRGPGIWLHDTDHDRFRPMKVLVTAASKHGATIDIAARIAAALTAAGHRTTMLPPQDVPTVEPYDAVVLGSAIYMGRWLGPATEFGTRHRADLAARPTWLFSSGPLGDPPGPDNPLTDVIALGRAIGARSHRVFPGLLDKRRLGFVEKTIAGAVKAPEGDFRPWQDIDLWARKIASTLAAAEPIAV